MTVSRLRLITQHLCFVLLTYGGRFGVSLGHSLPCLACPYIAGCGGHCYLMALQGGLWGLAMPLADMLTVRGFKGLGYLLLFLLLALLLNKFWCGWICPFGLLQDWIAGIRKKLGVREAALGWRTRDRLKSVKYILLAYLILVPLLIAHAGWHEDFSLPFCQICPAKPIMPLFVGDTSHLALDFTNTITLVFTLLSVGIAGAMLVGMLFKDRFFCLFCPMLVLIHMLKKISPVRFEKEVTGCLGCGNCMRMCPVDIRTVHEEKMQKDVMDEDCMLCMTCSEACPQEGVLNVKLFRWRLFSSSRDYVARRHH